MAVVLHGDIHVRQDNTSNIKIRITHHRKVKYISTDLYIVPDNLINGVATGKKSSFINGRIRDEIEIYSQRYQKLGKDADKMTANELMEKLLSGENSVEIDFLKFSDDYLQELKNEKREGSVRALRGFVKNIKTFKETVNFSDIDLNFLQEFQKFLKNKVLGIALIITCGISGLFSILEGINTTMKTETLFAFPIIRSGSSRFKNLKLRHGNTV